ncbi:MAG: hypothetical protein ACOCYB_04475 [Alkalispirochaeta sp.]
MDDPRRPTPWRGSGSESVHFHYNRAEREATRRRVWTPPTGGFFRRNRALTLTLIDVVVIIVLFAIVMFVVGPMSSRASLGDYVVSAEAVSFDQEILVAVTVIDSEADSPAGTPSDDVVTVRVGDADVSDLAPSISDRRTIRLRTALDAVRPSLRGDTLMVEVQIGNREETLRVKVSGESLER